MLIKQSLEVEIPVDLQGPQAYRGPSAPSGLSSFPRPNFRLAITNEAGSWGGKLGRWEAGESGRTFPLQQRQDGTACQETQPLAWDHQMCRFNLAEQYGLHSAKVAWHGGEYI